MREPQSLQNISLLLKQKPSGWKSKHLCSFAHFWKLPEREVLDVPPLDSPPARQVSPRDDKCALWSVENPRCVAETPGWGETSRPCPHRQQSARPGRLPLKGGHTPRSLSGDVTPHVPLWGRSHTRASKPEVLLRGKVTPRFLLGGRSHPRSP